MEAAVLLWFHLLLLVIFCNGFHVQGPSGSLTVQLGDSVMLPCFVETPLPMEELEVEWKRNDSGSLVHLWQNGESRPESQNQRYHERAHFFSEKVAHGNFSLLLTNVTREDAGVYKCVVHTNQHSDETLIEIMEIERLIVSGGHVISAYAGEEITLNCSVESHIPSEMIEEVSWKTDEGILVLLYQNSTVQTESTHGRFKGRVEFFRTEDRNKGNFSMRLKDVRTEDKGLYICSAFSGNLSDYTTVEVQQLGFSSMHIWIIVLCIIGFVIGSVILGYFSYTSFQKKDNSRRAQVIQCAHVLCPNITMSIVFILWGVTEGFLTEAATCSALNFVRIIFLFWIAVHLKSVEDYVHEVMDRLAVLLQYIVITVVAYSPIIVDLWNKTDNIGKVLVLTFLFLGSLLVSLHAVAVVCYRRNLQKVTDQSYANTEITNFLRLCAIIWTYSFQLNYLPVLLFPLLAIICFKVCVHCKCPIPVLHFVSVLLILQIMSVSGSIYIHYDLVTNMKERDLLTWITVFLHILTVIIMFASLHNFTVTRHPESRNTVTLPPVWSVVVFVIGSVLVVLVNAAVLLVALILKARNGQHTVDLQGILIPTECVFAACWLALQISVFWKNREMNVTQRCSTTTPLNHEHEHGPPDVDSCTSFLKVLTTKMLS